jgi:C-terminal processing protease CtpA/Prc
MRLLKPMTLHEPAGFFQAGPGLWIKSGLKSFEISRVVPRRPAAQAGLKPGDRVISIGGKTAGKMSFEEAVSRLYGKPGSKVELRVLRAGEAQGESLSLERGALARFEPGVEALREGRSVRVARVLSGSPAERAGIREGDALLSLGKDEAASLGDEELKERLLSDLTGENAPVFQSSGKPPRQVPLERGEFTTPLEPRIFEGN